MTAQQPKIYPMVFRPGPFQPDPKYFVITVHDSTEGWDYHNYARKAAIRHQSFGIWRPSRRRALIEAMNHHLWPCCTLARAKESPWIHVQFSLRGDNLPMLADLVMDGDQRALIDVLDRMDTFSHCPSGHWLSFRFPAHWAPSALGDARPICPHCRDTGALDYAHFAMDPCSCADAVAVMTGPDWPDAPHPLSPPPLSPPDASLSDAPAQSPEGRTQGNPTPAPDKSGPGQPGKDAA